MRNSINSAMSCQIKVNVSLFQTISVLLYLKCYYMPQQCVVICFLGLFSMLNGMKFSFNACQYTKHDN